MVWWYMEFPYLVLDMALDMFVEYVISYQMHDIIDFIVANMRGN